MICTLTIGPTKRAGDGVGPAFALSDQTDESRGLRGTHGGHPSDEATTAPVLRVGFVLNATTSIIGLVVAIVVAIICAKVAGGKGYSPVLFGILGFFFSLTTLNVVLVIPSKH